MIRNNDEPVYEDFLDHHALARRVGHRILKCQPPYVVGVCGSWGAGKTSFLYKLWAYLGGKFETHSRKLSSVDPGERFTWFKESSKAFDDLRDRKNLELIWFSPWQHQFESSPMIALLQEIRRHLSTSSKGLTRANKATKIAALTLLDSLPKLALEIGGVAGAPKFRAESQLPTAKSIIDRRREFDSDDFSALLASRRFRDYFEAAIESVAGKDGLLVIFIDDLDRCEGDVAYRLLEALKLYLNSRNCVYVLGLDQQHLEETIARALSGEKETWQFRYVARDYLNKMFQGLFLLPVPRRTTHFVEALLDKEDILFWQRLEQLFNFTEQDWPKLVQALDENLPHNPRKIKSFISSWKLYLDTLPEKTAKLDWRLTLVLHYLAQFEEPLFRKVEEAPEFYEDHIVRFCRLGESLDWRFKWMELPYEKAPVSPASGTTSAASIADDKGGISTTIASAQKAPDDSALQPGDRVKQPHRVFWISFLIRQINSELGPLDRDVILRHLLHTGDAAQPFESEAEA
ncbi:MAG: P-loop NTPase fold protein [Acidobacteriota bacterium]